MLPYFSAVVSYNTPNYFCNWENHMEEYMVWFSHGVPALSALPYVKRSLHLYVCLVTSCIMDYGYLYYDFYVCKNAMPDLDGPG